MLRINAQSQQQGIVGDLHDPRGSESVAHLSMSHSHHVHALRQPLKQSCDGIAHQPLQIPNRNITPRNHRAALTLRRGGGRTSCSPSSSWKEWYPFFKGPKRLWQTGKEAAPGRAFSVAKIISPPVTGTVPWVRLHP